METREAQAHLEMVDRILERANEPPYRPMGGLFVIWGVTAAILDVVSQIGLSRGLTPWLEVLGAIALAIAIGCSIWVAVSSKRRTDRMPLSEERMGKVFGAVWIGIFVAAFSQPYMFAGWSAAAIWSIGGGITLLINGFFGRRMSLLGAVVLFASVLIGNFAHQYAGYILAAGFLLGYVGTGVLYMTEDQRSSERG